MSDIEDDIDIEQEDLDADEEELGIEKPDKQEDGIRPCYVVLVFTAVDRHGDLEGVVNAVVDEAENRGMWGAHLSISVMDPAEVPDGSPQWEALYGREST